MQTNGVIVLFEDLERNADTALLGYPVYGLIYYCTYARVEPGPGCGL